MWWMPWLVACRDPEPTSTGTTAATAETGAGPDDSGAGPHSADATGHTGRGATSGHSGHTGHTGAPFDCAAIPEAPLRLTELGAARGHHDVAFDSEGHLLGVDGGLLVAATSDDRRSVVAAGLGQTNGVELLPDGDLAVASYDQSAVLRVAAGSVSPLSTGFERPPYGLALARDGRLWVADTTAIWSVDPTTGTREEVYRDEARGPRVLAFSPGSDALYFADEVSSGEVWRLPLDGALAPTGPAELLVTVPHAGSARYDALAIDQCGNLYLSDYFGLDLWRVDPRGGVALFHAYRGSGDFGHGLAFGSGLGGWREDALYLPRPDARDRVTEMVIGVGPARP